VEDPGAMQNQKPNHCLPRVVSSTNISLTDLEAWLLQKVFRDYVEIHTEKEFGGGLLINKSPDLQ
jgi:hypothetical protein